MSAGEPLRAEPPRVAGGAPPARVATNALHLVLGQVGTTALAVLLSAALGRVLGAADFGLYFLATSVATFAYVFVEWGQPPYVTREVARDAARAGELLGSALALRVATAAGVVSLATLATWLLGYDARTVRISAVLMVATLPLFLAQAFAMVFRGREHMGREALVAVANKALTLALSVAALGLGAGLAGVVVASGAAGVFALALAALLFRGLGGPPLRATMAGARELVVGGTPIVAMSLAVAVQGYLDAILLSKLAPAATVGWYGAAKNIFGTLVAPATILGAAAYPRLSRAATRPGELPREVRAAFRPLLAMAALGAVGTWTFADLAIGVVYGGETFGPAASILRAFAPGMFLLFVDVFLGSVILAVGRSKALAAAKVLNVAAIAALELALIPVFQAQYGNGGVAVVVAFGAAEIVMFAAAVWILPRGTLEWGVAGDIARTLGAGLATLVAYRALPPVPSLLGIPVLIALYAAFAALFGVLRRADLALVLGAVSRRGGARG